MISHSPRSLPLLRKSVRLLKFSMVGCIEQRGIALGASSSARLCHRPPSTISMMCRTSSPCICTVSVDQAVCSEHHLPDLVRLCFHFLAHGTFSSTETLMWPSKFVLSHCSPAVTLSSGSFNQVLHISTANIFLPAICGIVPLTVT